MDEWTGRPRHRRMTSPTARTAPSSSPRRHGPLCRPGRWRRPAQPDSAWVQVVPGLWEEPLGNVTLEAMMRGTCVVASDLGGPAEVVQHDRTGLLVPPGSVTALADALQGLLGDHDRCEEFGAAGRITALACYTEDLAVRHLERLYRTLLPPSTADPERSPA